MKRPVPVVLTAVLLGLFAAFQLLIVVLMVITGVVVLHKGLPGSGPNAPLPPSFLPGLFFGMSVFAAAIAVWLIFTLIGLVRMRLWARYSVLVIAGLMAAFGGLLMVSSFAIPFLAPAMPTAANQPTVDPHVMRGMFFVFGAIYALVTAIGVALLVYFNQATTRALFLLNTPVNLDPPNTSTGRVRPTAVTVISWIYLVSGPLCLVYLFLPFPAFFLGFVLYGTAAHALYLFFGGLVFAIGYGLLRLHNWARLTVFALFAICPIQMVMFLTPWGRHQFQAYMDAANAFNEHLLGAQAVQPNIAMSPGAIVFFCVLGMAGYGVVLWLLHRHRAAFTPAPPAPPMPASVEPVAG